MIVSFEDSFLSSKVADVNCGEANAEVANLNQKFHDVNVMIEEHEGIDDELRAALELLFSRMIKILEKFNKVLPVVNALCSQGMKARHWNTVNVQFEYPH
jgi:hypothetical protein